MRSFFARRNEQTTNSWQLWQNRLFASPSPAEAKLGTLARHSFPSATWIETGTWKGDTTAFLAKEGGHVFTIEPDENHFANAHHRFSTTANVSCVKGTSEEVLETVLQSANSATVNFWLDGHFSGKNTFQGPADTPIEFELGVIAASRQTTPNVAIFIDDVRCFVSPEPDYASYPSLDFLVDYARSQNLAWTIEHDIFIAKSRAVV